MQMTVINPSTSSLDGFLRSLHPAAVFQVEAPASLLIMASDRLSILVHAQCPFETDVDQAHS